MPGQAGSTAFRLSLLGAPQLERDGVPAHLPRRKAVALLAYLAVSGQAHSREALATLLWPEHDQSRALANLRRTLWELNQTMGAGWLEIDAETVALRRTPYPLSATPGRPPSFWLDVEAFRQNLSGCTAHGHGEEEICPDCLPPLTAAVELYGGEFMAGFTLPDSSGFDEWQFFERESLRAELAGALQSLMRCYTARQDWAPAIHFARRWLALDPLHEAAHRALMKLYAWDGQWAAALRQYQECVRILDEELAAPPDEDTARLYEEIQARRLPPPPAATGDTPLPAAPRHNLPSPPTPFVGREAELAEITRLLQDPDCRLLTLVGPGGMGKSRLALQAAAEQLPLASDRHPDGIYLVPLAPVASECVVAAIAEALGFCFSPQERDDPKQQLLNYLGDKQMLLLLDNLEEIAGGGDLLSEILEQGSAPAMQATAAGSGLRLLVTSRERLNLRGEWVFEVLGLRYPGEEPVESLEGYDAVQLFLRRAGQVDAGFSVPQEQVRDLLRICRLVEGMPLAIELSAAWVKMLSCREIADEIERSLDFLTGSWRDLPERHRSLRAVCDHSWSRLSEAEQGAFQRLAVFQGGFRREAAAQVAGASLPLLSALVDKSLVHYNPSSRYEVHPILLQYAAEKLGEDPREAEEARERHAAYFVAFVQHREGALQGGDQIKALQEMGADLPNVRMAWRWAVARGRVEEIRKAALGLWLFYEMRSLFEEGEEAFAQAVTMLEGKAGQGVAARGDGADEVALGVTLALKGALCSRLYDFEDAVKMLRRSLTLLRRLGAPRELALADGMALYGGAPEGVAEAEQLMQESLQIYRGLGDRWGAAFVLSWFHWTAHHLWGAHAGAKQLLLESLAISREIGDRWGEAFALYQLGEVLESSGVLREARDRYQESLAVFREIGDRRAEQQCLDHIGYAARALQEYEEARRYHRQSLVISREIGDRLGTAGSLHNLGLVARDLGDYEEAAQYFREGLAIRVQVGHQWSIADSLAHLAEVAFAQRDDEEARRLYQESLEVGRGAEWLVRPTAALRGLGDVSVARGEFRQAQQHFRAALEAETAVQGGHLPLILEVLVSIARLAAAMGKPAESAAALAFVAAHAMSHAQTSAKAERLLNELASQLPPPALAAAGERHAGRTLEEVVRAVLQEL
jgi:predicted ATPase/DNA-binding SARP family transcriptional activator